MTESKLIEIYSGSQVEVSILTTMLDDEEIIYYVNGEYTGVILPAITSGAMGSIVITVGEEDYERAKEIVERFKNGAIASEE
mgnify:CR=1 FL=1